MDCRVAALLAMTVLDQKNHPQPIQPPRQLLREPGRGGAGRTLPVLQSEKRPHPGRGRGGGLGGKPVEAALDDRQSAAMSGAEPRRLVEGVVPGPCRSPARNLLDQGKHTAKLRDLAAGVGADEGAGRGGLLVHAPDPKARALRNR